MTYFDKKPSFSRKNTAFQCTGITAAQIPVFGIVLNTGMPVLGIGIGSFTKIAISDSAGSGSEFFGFGFCF